MGTFPWQPHPFVDLHVAWSVPKLNIINPSIYEPVCFLSIAAGENHIPWIPPFSMFHLCFGLKIPHLWETSCASSHFGCFRPPHPAALGFHIKRAVLLDVNPAAWPVQFHVCSLAVLLFQTPLIDTKSACLLFQTTHFSIVKCPMSVVSISIFVGQIPWFVC
jgi:hypothetical protein